MPKLLKKKKDTKQDDVSNADDSKDFLEKMQAKAAEKEDGCIFC